jgi:glyoxylase-like metal-dependent hydrolase (beta-lactamase superfamily II)
MAAILKTIKVGLQPVNSYLIVCEETGTSAIIDPGADADAILENARDTKVEKILLTHGHANHVSAVDEIKAATGAPIYLHPADAKIFSVSYDIPLADGDVIPVGNLRVKTIHTPGHTPGATCFDLGDGRVLVGDVLFVGGPGATKNPEAFTLTLRNLQSFFFTYPDETIFYPGHGSSGRVGNERPAFEDFIRHGWHKDLCGDVTWTLVQ